ncbi:MAG: Aliphatic sulfonates import ATP-binding protein SsuB [Fimbriimonadaceae bacterium]|nr:Aliphatic sulfonates import ATP-binding protein SsuB [Fimbriimonadaceae bacterium]
MVRCERLGKRYGRRWIFRNVTFAVSPGDCLVVIGSNGSGKSTLLKTLAGLIPSTEGQCFRGDDRRQDLGYAALDQPVYPVLTVAEHLVLSANLRGCEPRVDELLDEVELGYARDVAGRHLSTGMRARLKFALAIQAEPAAVLLDEPSAGLDARGREIVNDLIERRRERTAFVIATNDPNERKFATHELNLDGRDSGSIP